MLRCCKHGRIYRSMHLTTYHPWTMTPSSVHLPKPGHLDQWSRQQFPHSILRVSVDNNFGIFSKSQNFFDGILYFCTVMCFIEFGTFFEKTWVGRGGGRQKWPTSFFNSPYPYLSPPTGFSVYFGWSQKVQLNSCSNSTGIVHGPLIGT